MRYYTIDDSMESKIKIFVLTHKKFDENLDESIYTPLLNGSALHDDDFGYLRDDSSDNISKLNPYYAEMTGEYWAWKNAKCDIIGFCHYRRYFAKGISLKKLEKTDIEKILLNYDIIIPNKVNMGMTHIEDIEKTYKYNNIGPKIEEYHKLRDVIESDYPEYLSSFDELLGEKSGYGYNMFICRKDLADDYFEWLFDILDKVNNRIDYSEYDEDKKRILGYLSERLLNVYIKNNDLKIKEKPILFTDTKFPWIYVIGFKVSAIFVLFKWIKEIKYKFSR